MHLAWVKVRCTLFIEGWIALLIRRENLLEAAVVRERFIIDITVLRFCGGDRSLLSSFVDGFKVGGGKFILREERKKNALPLRVGERHRIFYHRPHGPWTMDHGGILPPPQTTISLLKRTHLQSLTCQ